MKTIPALLITLFLFFARSYSQQVRTTFTIRGITTPADSGRMLLIPLNTEDYYPFHGTLEARVLNGMFTLTDSIAYPTSYIIGLKYDSNWKYLSSPFYVDPGVQTLSCNTNNLREVPAITNRSMLELQNDYNTSFASLHSQYIRYDAIRDSLNEVYKYKIPDSLGSLLSSIDKDLDRKFDSTLLSYVKRNPGSYVAFWKLVNEFTHGYKPFYDSLYEAFSDSIRQTYTGKVLKHKLEMGRFSCIGCRFPDLKLASINDLSGKVSLSGKLSKYTLIDIWFSHCAPCIEQFTMYKEIYARFRHAGFQLIGVSTDSKDQIQNWKTVISQNVLPWPQYLDENGIVAKELSIISWPSNFLIDEKGIIIQRDISPEALELFLNANIKSK
jgi:peroxiredoxin